MNKKNPFVDHPPYLPVELSQEARAEAEEVIELYENTSWHARKFLLEYLTEAAELGHPKVQKYLARLYEGIDYDTQQNTYQDAAAYWYEQAARQGDSDAQCKLGYYYEFVQDDEESALHWYLTSVENAAEAEDPFPVAVESALDILDQKIAEGELSVDTPFSFLEYGAECGSLQCMRLLTEQYGEHAPRTRRPGTYRYQYEDQSGVSAAKRLEYLRKLAPAYVKHRYDVWLEDVQELVADEPSNVIMAQVTVESAAYYDAGCVAEGEQRYGDAYEQYRKAAEAGHAVAAWRLVTLCPMMANADTKESAYWYHQALAAGHPIPNHDLPGILRMAWDGNGEALEYLSLFCREESKKPGMGSLETIAEYLWDAAKTVYELYKDVFSVGRLLTMQDGLYKDEYNALLWIRKQRLIHTILTMPGEEYVNKKVYSQGEMVEYPIMVNGFCAKLRAAGLKENDLHRLNIEVQREVLRARAEARQEAEERRREEEREGRRQAEERKRAMQAFREKLDDRERIINALLGDGLHTDLENTIMGNMSSSQYSTSALYREIKEEEYRRSLE